MPLFATFYSYKGGVGRTLALANVAWLLANHPTEPARVLVIDFDLGAPGLHRVLKMPRKATSLGLIDYVLKFTATATVPLVQDYIHRTAYSRIDIIPAGRLDNKYQSRLNSLNWTALYENAYGYELIEALKTSISQLPADYDYVLVDSLTGFSDVGGICVKQIPDSLILLFRLNQQNLDGIDTVFKSASRKKGLMITPVISPAWPFIDQASDIWLEKSRHIFGKLRLNQISFDSGLSFGERIIANLSERLTLIPKVISDYQHLAVHLRNQNASDPLTLWENLRFRTSSLTTEGIADLQLRLLEKRPNNLAYWQYLETAVPRARRSRRAGSSNTSAYGKLMSFIDDQCKSGNKLALLGRASLALSLPDSVQKALDDLSAALKNDAKFYEARFLRARIYLSEEENGSALSDLLVCFAQLSTKDTRRREVASEIASIALELFDGPTAFKFAQIALDGGVSTFEFLRCYVKASYLDGKYAQGIEVAERLLRLAPRDELTGLHYTQLLAAAGRLDDAKAILEKMRREINIQDAANLAEAYLAVDPRTTIEILRSTEVDVQPPVRRMLRQLAWLLLHHERPIEMSEEEFKENVSTVTSGTWNTFEVVSLIITKRRKAELSDAAYTLAAKVINEGTGQKLPT